MRSLVPLLVSALLTYFLFADLGASALLGFDAYPLIAASRVDSLLDLGQSVSMPLMGFRYPDGDFYRPLVHLSFGFDDWWSDQSLDPRAFHRTDLAIAFLSALILGAIASRAVAALRKDPRPDDSRAPEIAAAVTTIVVYLLHRAQLDAVPYAPRRADTMCVLFLAWAVYAAYSGRRAGAVALLAALSFFSKETGALSVPLVALAAWIRPESPEDGAAPAPKEDAAARDPKALRTRTILWTAGAVALAILVRTLVLQGLGGHRESGTAQAAAQGTEIAADIVKLWCAGVPGGVAIPLSLLALIAGNLILSGGAARRLCVLCGAWMFLVLAITAFSGRAHAWYVVPLLAPIAVLAGTAAGAAFTGRRGPGVAGAAAAVALAALMGRHAIQTPQHTALRIAEPIAADQVQRFNRLLSEIKPGERRVFEPHVIGVVADPQTPPVFLHAPYSFRALAELEQPNLSVGIAPKAPGPPGATHSDIAEIDLVPGPPPAAFLSNH